MNHDDAVTTAGKDASFLPVERLFEELDKLRGRNGWPSYRRMAEETGIPRATLSRWCLKKQVPEWDRLAPLLLFFAVEPKSAEWDRWKKLWRAAHRDHRTMVFRQATRPASRPEPEVTPSRRWAVVQVAISPVHHEPDANDRPLKHKYRGDRVELFTELPPSPGGRWLAVRTPANTPGYKWMYAEDLALEVDDHA